MLENKNGPIKIDDHISKTDGDIMMISPLLFGLVWFVLSIEYIVNVIIGTSELDKGLIILNAIWSIFLISVGWLFYTNHKAYFDYSAEGLGVKYLLQKRKVIPWNEFQQVCVCYASYSTRGEGRAHSVLCFVKKGEKQNVYGRWKADNPFHNRSVITMEYTDELYEEVKKHCPYEIPDLRGKGNYRL